MKKMKVCELLDTYYPVVDGAINVVSHYSELLNEVVECKLAAPKAKRKSKYVDNESFEVIRCLAFPAPEGYRLAQPWLDGKFRKKMVANNFDLIHTHSPFSLGRYVVKLGKKYKIPVVVTLHTLYHHDFLRACHGSKLCCKIALKYMLHVFNKADSVWTVSEKAKEYLHMYGYKGEVKVMRNGTDFEYPDNPQELIDRINDLHGLANEKRVFVFVGRMAWYKNLKMILDGLNILKQADKDFKMIFVGGGFDLDEVKAYAKTVGIDDRCIFTDEVKDKELLKGYYLRSDLKLFPSTFDTAGVVKIEAAAHKKACLLVANSCSAEGVVDGENGFLCEETAKSLADRLLKVIDQDELLKTVGENAYKTLHRTWKQAREEIICEYEKILENYKAKFVGKDLVKYQKAKLKAEKIMKKSVTK